MSAPDPGRMFRPHAFKVDDAAVLRDVLRQRVFVTLATIRDARIAFSYAPVAVDETGLRFHLAIRNPMGEMQDGARVTLTCLAADAYVSPDWYRDTITVPTWNYIAVEAEGLVRRLTRDALRALLEELSAREEDKLLPKPPWKMDKVSHARNNALMNVIVGFRFDFERLEGKFKLSQDKTEGDIAGVIEGLEKRGDAASLAVARAMRETKT